MFYRKTRKQRAQELLRLVTNGPLFGTSPLTGTFTRDDAHKGYDLWVKTWVLPELMDLVPELRPKKES